MKTIIKTFVIASTAAVALAGSINASANATEALKGCKAKIAEDSRLVGQDINARMDSLKSRGRNMNFIIDINATTAGGMTSKWQATCQARGTGKVNSLELAQVSADGEMVVADN
jgi:hypothetical protein